MRWTSLHHHSSFSHLDGYQMPEAHVRRAAELGMTALALTEHGTTSSHVKLEQAAKLHGIKPVFGCELYTATGKQQQKNHLTVLAEDTDGYRNLLRMVSWSWQDGFYYHPTVSGEVLADHSDGLIVLSGCNSSLLSCQLVGGKTIDASDASYDRAHATARRFKQLLGDRFFLEVQTFPELESTKAINQGWERISKDLNIPMVATADCHYTKPTESEMQTVLHAIRPSSRNTVEEQARAWGYDVKLAPYTSDKEVMKRLVATGMSKRGALSAIENTSLIAQRCTVELPKAKRLRFPLPAGHADAQSLWEDLLAEGWYYRGIDDGQRREEYKTRVRYEMSIIEQKDFVDYFLVVADMVRFAKDAGIPVGPARGSAAGSLVCYLLRITEVDPMKFRDLIFERFIDITRQDMPDIDLDFDDERREEVKAYMETKYGKNQVATLGTFTMFKSKNSLDDIARVYRIPPFEVDKVKELLLERSSGDLRASATIEDTMKMFPEAKKVFDDYPDLSKAMLLEGNVKGMGTHAAGLMISNDPITDLVAVYQRQGASYISIDKHDAEYLGMLKIDVLGLSTMGMIGIALSHIGMPLEEMYKLPLDDEKVIKSFRDGDVVGVFQFDGRAMRLVNSALKPDNFYEVCVVNALARPGPLHNNSVDHYVSIKFGKSAPVVLDPMFDEIVGNTYGQVVYQEQILRILREMGGFDWTSLMYVRKIISHKEGEQAFSRYWEKFRDGCAINNVEELVAKKIWGMCITAGAYAFNAAHSVSYGMLAYWTMWLKVHHPSAFYMAALRKHKTKQRDLLRDATKHGIKVLPPDPNKSQSDWSVNKKTVLAGFEQIHGVGTSMAEKFIAYREEVGKRITWDDFLDVKGVGPKTMERIKAWAEQEDPLDVYALQRRLDAVTTDIEAGKVRDKWGNKVPVPTHKSSDIEYGIGKTQHVVWIGIVNNKNLRDLYEVNFSRTGVALDPNKTRDPHLREWVLFQGQDGEDIITITIDRWKYPELKELVWKVKLKKDLIVVKGQKKGGLPHKTIYVDRMWVLS